MFHTAQTLQPVPTVFRTGLVGPRFETDPPTRLVEDRETLYKEFATRLHALVWCEG